MQSHNNLQPQQAPWNTQPFLENFYLPCMSNSNLYFQKDENIRKIKDNRKKTTNNMNNMKKGKGQPIVGPSWEKEDDKTNTRKGRGQLTKRWTQEKEVGNQQQK